MKVSSVSVALGLAVLLLSGLAASSPEESVSLRCEGQPSSAGWTVRRTVRRTVGAKTQKCGGGPDDFGSSEGSSCIMLDVSSSSDSGVYWCENSDGQRSPELNVTVSDVILVVPPVPVTRGSEVTLLCRTRGGSSGVAYFFKEDVHIGSSSEGEFTIGRVQISDDGFYFCSTDLTGPSSRSRLTVREAPPTPPPQRSTPSPGPGPSSTPPPPPPHSPHLLRVLVALLSLSVLVSVLAGALLFCGKQTDLAVRLLFGLAVSAGLTVLLLSVLAASSSGILLPHSMSVETLLSHLLIISPYCISTILMASIYCSRRTGNKQGAATEMAKRVEGEDHGSITSEPKRLHEL